MALLGLPGLCLTPAEMKALYKIALPHFRHSGSHSGRRAVPESREKPTSSRDSLGQTGSQNPGQGGGGGGGGFSLCVEGGGEALCLVSHPHPCPLPRYLAKLSSVGSISEEETCEKLKGLIQRQVQMCKRNLEVMDSVRRGAQLAIEECQYQFRNRRWNCSTLDSLPVFGKVVTQGEGGARGGAVSWGRGGRTGGEGCHVLESSLTGPSLITGWQVEGRE